jgi:hypothetical protein
MYQIKYEVGMGEREETNSSFAMSRSNSLCSADSEDARARFAALVSATGSRSNISSLTVFMSSGQRRRKVGYELTDIDDGDPTMPGFQVPPPWWMKETLAETQTRTPKVKATEMRTEKNKSSQKRYGL